MTGDRGRCWADPRPQTAMPNMAVLPCNKTAVTDLGLCLEHYKQIVPPETRRRSDDQNGSPSVSSN